MSLDKAASETVRGISMPFRTKPLRFLGEMVRRLCAWPRSRPFLLNRRVALLLILVSVFLLHEVYKRISSITMDSRLQQPEECERVKLALYPNERFRELFKNYPKPNCTGQNWVDIHNGVFKILEYTKKSYGNITCDILPVLRDRDDFHNVYGRVIKGVQDGWNVTAEVSKVSCKAGTDEYSNYHMTVPYVERLHRLSEEKKLPEGGLGMNILMFGFDSVSRMTWQRKLPNTYKYMMEELNSVVLEGYNIIGDGTVAALVPILTGKTPEELPEARRGHSGAETVDGYPLIWRDFSDAGYVTQFVEDMADIGLFTSRMHGFNAQPTDHYARRFFMEEEKLGHEGELRYCLGSRYKHEIMFDYLRDFEIMYKNRRRFSFGFYTNLSHDDTGPLNVADDDMQRWLHLLKIGGLLHNTILILFGDHGARFQGLRETSQGRTEERNPFFSISLPSWFRRRYSDAYKNLLINSKRLTTPFDIHATLKSTLHFSSPPINDISQGGISIFSEISVTRSCDQAHVGPHWCNCASWVPIQPYGVEAQYAAKAIIRYVNQLNKDFWDICYILEIVNVVEARKHAKKRDVNFLKNNHRASMFLGKAEIQFVAYQIAFHTEPGGGHYEATVTYDPISYEYAMDANGISRTNAYGKDARCLPEDMPELKPYCYCKIHSVD